MRSYASNKTLPEYPAEARRAGATGVAVAKIRVDESGVLRSVQILQVPHASIAEATTAALTNWVFNLNSANTEQPECHSGKITFYFVIEDGEPHVRDPKVFQTDNP